MKNIETLLRSIYTIKVVRGVATWKRGTRVAESTDTEFVHAHLLSVSMQKHNSDAIAVLAGKKAESIEFIKTWFEEQTQAAMASDTGRDEQIVINEFIMSKFDSLFNLDIDSMQITMRGCAGNSYVNTTRAANIIMATSERELNILPTGFSVERVRRTLEFLMITKRETKRNELLSLISYDPEADHSGDDEYITRWIRKLFLLYKIGEAKTGDVIEATELNIVMMRHMLYSIKRAVFGYRPPDCRFMYTFFSRKQGTGKSQFVKHTTDPFRFTFTDQGTLDMLVNKNDLKALTSERMVIDIQELASTGDFTKESYAALKSAITSDSVGGRVLYSVESEAQPMLSVFMSSTNIHVADLIRDETGLRRFYSFDFHNQRKENDWVAIDKHWSYIASVYKRINELGPAPLTDKMPIFSELEKVQEDYKRMSDVILDWERETGNHIVKDHGSNTRKISKQDLHTSLKKYCLEREGFNLKLNTMRNMLISRHSIYPVSEGEVEFYYYIPKESERGLTPVTTNIEIPGWSNGKQEDTSWNF